MLLARFEIASSWSTMDDYVPSIRKVTAQDILRVAKLYFAPDKRTVAILNPLPPEPGQTAPSASPLKGNIIRKAEDVHAAE
jgi:predicted Zn-dependent peptidase